ncbi:MAG: DUF3501 family protein [Alphaproteobacteria bacterium]
MAKAFTPADILPLDIYEQQRPKKRLEILELKKNRRVHVGPHAVFLFENAETLWWQIHEMLRIEKGGDAQLEDELRAYNPLLPQGNDLVATLMLEISDSVERKALLTQWGHLEETVFLQVGGFSVQARSVDTEKRTDPSGKTSSVHFLRFSFDAQAKLAFLKGSEPTSLHITHPGYAHQAPLPQAVHEALCEDLMP